MYTYISLGNVVVSNFERFCIYIDKRYESSIRCTSELCINQNVSSRGFTRTIHTQNRIRSFSGLTFRSYVAVIIFNKFTSPCDTSNKPCFTAYFISTTCTRVTLLYMYVIQTKTTSFVYKRKSRKSSARL